MAARRKTREREAQLAFDALSIEGGLLSPDWLSRAAQLAAGQQSEADYRVPKGLNLRDEIGRYWRVAQAYWKDFEAGRSSNADRLALAERFVLALLRESFGFTSLAPVAPIALGGRAYPIGFCALGRRVPVVIAQAPPASAETEIETTSQRFGDEGRRRSAFGLTQEYLNADEGALWGIVADGVKLRILRDNASLTRPAWIEADLARIFTEERYADFAALWLLVYETRFGRPDQPVTECALETWRNAGREEGTRAREHLRSGVEEALVALGQGFLAHPENQALRAALQDGSLTTTAYFQQLLRLVYRLIFLLTVEERALLHPPNDPSDATAEAAKKLYRDGYSLRRLRERSIRRSAHDRFSDLWEATKIVFRGAATGEPRLALPALAGIFAKNQCPALDAAKLQNRALLLGVFRLSWLREKSGLARVNWRDMGPEELGSVYESLLELVPRVAQGERSFSFAVGDETRGNARKTTGSYYTPDSLVQVLLDSALEPVVQSTLAGRPDKPVEALLQLSIVDPACGSGHFLLAAARRLAGHVARLRANGTPSAADYRHALREVVGHCVYGVDLNPMAVELCKVSLWMEAIEPGLPLTFLNSHIQHGNALLGATPTLLAKGVPDIAWECIEGDHKAIGSALRKQNKKERAELTLDFVPSPVSTYARLGEGARAVDDAMDGSLTEVESKALRWDELVASAAYTNAQFIADLWCAAFVWRKEPVLREVAPTEATYRAAQREPGRVSLALRHEVVRLRGRYRFLHWHLAFPQVFARGGFDVVLGNPPWERVKLQEQEFFASRSEEIASAPNASARKKLIATLPQTDPQLWSDWCAASREAEGQSHFVRQSGCYPLCGKGDVNTYALFAEHNGVVLGPTGRAGFIVPTGIATDDTTKEFFQALVDGGRLRALYDFQSGPGLFGAIGHGTFKFALVTLSGASEIQPARLSFYSRSVSEATAPEKLFTLSAADIRALNPNTRTCPTFRSGRDAEITKAIYRRVPVFVRDGDPSGNPWGIVAATRWLHMAEDSEIFHTRDSLAADGFRLSGNSLIKSTRCYLPLYEAKMVHHFDHRYGDYRDRPDKSENTSLPEVAVARLADPTYAPLSRYWVDRQEVEARLAQRSSRGWLLGWRDITKPQNERTVIAALLPRVAVSHTIPVMFTDAEPRLVGALYANLSSFALDYAARQKIGGTHLTVSYLKQLPVLRPTAYAADAPWDPATTLRDWILLRVLELAFTAWDLEAFAEDVGYRGSPFKWDPARRFLLRAELDAAYFYLYGLSHEDAGHVLDSFPIVRKDDEKAYGEYRTKGAILERYDAMEEAVRSGRAYVTRLDPPAADARVAHPPKVERLPLPPMPGVVPTLDPSEEIARVIWAMLHAHGGIAHRIDLARAFSLRSQPDVLVRLARDNLSGSAKAWAAKVGRRTVTPGALARVLKVLVERDGIRLDVDGSARSVVGVSAHTPSVDLVGPWADFEARLALAVLGGLSPHEISRVDEGVAGDDRELLEIGVA